MTSEFGAATASHANGSTVAPRVNNQQEFCGGGLLQLTTLERGQIGNLWCVLWWSTKP